MTNPNETSAESDSGGSNAVTEHQLDSILGYLQLETKMLSNDTLNANQKLNLLTIKTLGSVYALAATFHLFLAASDPSFTLSQVNTHLQTLLILLASLYGFLMLLFGAISKLVSAPSKKTNNSRNSP